MWISAPTPVISSTNAADSGSNSSPARTSRLPVEMNVNRSRFTPRPSFAANWKVLSRPTTNAARIVPQPSGWPHRSVRRPPISSTAAPAAGSAMSSQDQASSPEAGRVSGTGHPHLGRQDRGRQNRGHGRQYLSRLASSTDADRRGGGSDMVIAQPAPTPAGGAPQTEKGKN